MKNKKLPLPLVWLMCVSLASGYFSVICHGSGGQVTVRPAAHAPCECPGSSQTGGQAPGIDCLPNHKPCTDSVSAPTVLRPERKNDKPVPLPLCIAAQAPKPIFITLPSFFSTSLTLSSEVLPFHAPLKTVILLA